MSQKIFLYDTTMRDGAQTEGISLSVSDKMQILAKLDELAIPYIEGGWPMASPKEMEFFLKAKKELKLKHSVLTAFGSTRKANMAVGKDPQVKSLLDSGAQVATIFGKTWDLHVKEVFRVPLEENLKMIHETVAYLKKQGVEVMYDAEHFFDGYRANPEFALKTLEAAADAGASTIILCDTNGGSLPHYVYETVKLVRARIAVQLGIHCHNDSELAVANSIAAVEAGVAQIQGTINGYGERCGNANLSSIIPVLQLKMDRPVVPSDRLKHLTEVSHFVAEICNMRTNDHQPFVGASAFAHKGGVHINAVLKNTLTYEHIDPALVGNEQRLLISEMGGKTTIQARAKKLKIDPDADPEKAKAFLATVRERENAGFHYEVAEGSLELLLRKAYDKFKSSFDLEKFSVLVEKTPKELTSQATIKLKVDGKTQLTVGEGDGPVNALDQALRSALQKFYPQVGEMHLVDFKVRVLESDQGGTAARVRVLIQSQDEDDSWWTIGVSENIIEASWQALVDSVEYKLLKDKK